MSINRRLSIICSVLLALFALSITVPTDIDAKTRYKTSRKISGNKKKKRRSSSKCLSGPRVPIFAGWWAFSPPRKPKLMLRRNS